MGFRLPIPNQCFHYSKHVSSFQVKLLLRRGMCLHSITAWCYREWPPRVKCDSWLFLVLSSLPIFVKPIACWIALATPGFMGAEHLHKLPGLRNACASKHQATNDLRLVDSYICIYHFEHAHKILSANFKFVFRIWKPHLQKALFALSDGAAATVLRRICCCLPNPGDDFTTACFVPNSVAVGISSSDSSFKHEPSQRRKDICFSDPLSRIGRMGRIWCCTLEAFQCFL